MLIPHVRDNHLCLGIRVDEVPDGEPFGKLRESVIIEPINCKDGKLTLKILTIRYEGNTGYRGPDYEVTINYKEQWTSKNHMKRHKSKVVYKGTDEYNKLRVIK